MIEINEEGEKQTRIPVHAGMGMRAKSRRHKIMSVVWKHLAFNILHKSNAKMHDKYFRGSFPCATTAITTE